MAQTDKNVGSLSWRIVLQMLWYYDDLRYPDTQNALISIYDTPGLSRLGALTDLILSTLWPPTVIIWLFSGLKDSTARRIIVSAKAGSQLA